MNTKLSLKLSFSDDDKALFKFLSKREGRTMKTQAMQLIIEYLSKNKEVLKGLDYKQIKEVTRC